MKNLLQIKNMTLSIANKTICHDLSFEICARDIWGILGPNGSGKTTLLQALANLHPVEHGEILLGDKNISSLSAKAISQQLGFLFQDTHDTFLQTVLESCLAGRHPYLSRFGWENERDKSIALQALKMMELDNKLTQKINSLSGGERQRLAIATLLTQSPSLYLLDEPTNHLDIYHQVKVLNNFKVLANDYQAGIIMSLHDVNIANFYCNNILMIFDDGKILLGKPDTLLTVANLERLYQHPLQMGWIANKPHWVPDIS